MLHTNLPKRHCRPYHHARQQRPRSLLPGTCLLAGSSRAWQVRQAAVTADIDAIVSDLPIREVIHDIVQSLDHHSSLVLQAPPGAGKTTTVPLALLLHKPEYLKDGQKIMVLEPRRVAAKSAARRMAALLGEPVGRTVGYRVKLETRVSSSTRIEVVTEGILLRRLQQDPTLEGVGALLLDEFHERSLDADTSLTLALDCQAWARPDLRLAVMSATLGGDLARDLQHLMSGQQAAADSTSSESSSSSSSGGSSSVPVIISEGRSYPVSTHYLGRPVLQKRGELEAAAADAVLRALQSKAAADGDVLVFLPGVGEIHRLQQMLLQEPAIRKASVAVQQLHGSLPPQLQDEVIRPRRTSQQRRVILSTPIAESSITIDGVTAVIDSGLARAPRYDPATGISRLVTQRIALDAAEQRRGRAGRTRAGVCYRLWDPQEEQQMLGSTPPEICSADLAPLALQLASWGSPEGEGLAWLDPPEPHALAEARALLEDLAAVDNKGSLTDTGRRMAAVPAHPRFAHMVLRAQQLGCPDLGSLLAAVLSERDLFRGSNVQQRNADLTSRLQVLVGAGETPDGFDAVGAQRVLLSGQQILRQLPAAAAASQTNTTETNTSDQSNDSAASTVDELDEAEDSMEEDTQPPSSGSRSQRHAANDASFTAACRAQLQKPGLLGALVAAAYADRIAQLKPGSGGKPAYSLSSGRSVVLPSATDPLASHQYIAVADLQAGRDGRNDRVMLGAGLPPAAIQTYLADEIRERLVVFWAAASKAVGAKRQKVLGSLVLSEQAVKVEDDQALPVLLKGLSDSGWSSLPIPAAAEAWRTRAAWLHDAEVAGTGSSSLPDLSTGHLLATMDSWLAPHLSGVRNKAQLQKLPWMDIFKGQMEWSLQQRVEEDAPSHVLLPTGSKAAISYAGAQPKASVKLQEVFGLADTPLLGGQGVKVPLLLELLSPAGRPLQVTANLATFWSEAYTAVKKEMKGRYPKHPWPDDPANTAPTKMTKKQLAATATGGGSSSDNTGGGAGNGSKPGLTTGSKKSLKRK